MVSLKTARSIVDVREKLPVERSLFRALTYVHVQSARRARDWWCAYSCSPRRGGVNYVITSDTTGTVTSVCYPAEPCLFNKHHTRDPSDPRVPGHIFECDNLSWKPETNRAKRGSHPVGLQSSADLGCALPFDSSCESVKRRDHTKRCVNEDITERLCHDGLGSKHLVVHCVE